MQSSKIASTQIKNSPKNHPFLNFIAIFRGGLFALMLILILSVITGIIYYFSDLPENTLPWVAHLILAIIIFAGAILAVNRLGAKGLQHGLGVGVLCFGFILIISGLFLPGNIFLTGLSVKLILALIAGAAGGILGINLSS